MANNHMTAPSPGLDQFGSDWIGLGAGVGLLFGTMLGHLVVGMIIGAALGALLMVITSAQAQAPDMISEERRASKQD